MPDRPIASRLPCESSIGSVFHSLHATSQALQPMHTEVSVKKPTRAGWSASYPASPCTSGSGPNNRCCGSLPVKAGLAELIVTIPPRWRSSDSCRNVLCPCVTSQARSRGLLTGRGLHRGPPVHADPAGLHPGAPPVGLDELEQLRPPRTAARPD